MAVATKNKGTSSSKLSQFFTSSIGKKYLSGVTGIGLVLFVIVHLLGNLSLYVQDAGEAFNSYGAFLHEFGLLFYAIELGLLALILIHAFIGVVIYLDKRKARPVGYKKYKSVGGPSKQSFSSRSMIVTGVVLFVFLIVHVLNFRFGTYYEVALSSGATARDLHRLVIEKFQNLGYVIFYVAVMILMIFHLRHGIWSALQSLGAMRPGATRIVYPAAAVLALLLGLGFLGMPVYIYLAY